MLAPVLARLDRLPGVARARADGTGTFLRLDLRPGADPAVVARAALAALGPRAAELPPAEAAAQLEGAARGDLWLAADEVLGLSYLEARMLSVRLPSAVERGLPLGPGGAARLAEAIRTVLFAAVERVHAEGGRESSGWFFEAWPALAAEIATRHAAGGGAAGPDAAAVEEALESSLG